MVQSWKDCVGVIPPGVRIPFSPNVKASSLSEGFYIRREDNTYNAKHCLGV